MEYVYDLVRKGRINDAERASLAIVELRTLLGCEESTIASLRVASALCFACGNLEGTERACHRILVLAGEDPAALSCLCDVHIHRSEFERAATMAARAWMATRSAFGAEEPMTTYMLGRAVSADLVATGDFEAAIVMLRMVCIELRAKLGKDSVWTMHMQGALRAARRDKSRSCVWCGSQSGLRCCGGCMSARYCSKEHQRLHWIRHRGTCHRPKRI